MITDKWNEAMLENREIITAGDINLNSLFWKKDLSEWTPYEKTRLKMYTTLKSKLLDQGNFQINSERTRENETCTGAPACLDMFFTTHPQKITSHDTIYPTFSDHGLVIINRSSSRMEKKGKISKITCFQRFQYR